MNKRKTESMVSGDQQCSAQIDCCEKIRESAYSRWEEAGCPCSDGVEFWLEAEVELTNGNQPSSKLK